MRVPGGSKLALLASVLLSTSNLAALAGPVPSVRPAGTLASASDTTAGDPDLRPSTAPPWNPAKPVADSEPWETALRVPGLILSLPIYALGHLTERGLMYVEESNFVPRVSVILARYQGAGLVVVPASLGDRTGLGAEAQVSPPFFRPLSAALSGSTAGYNRARVTLTAGPAGVEYVSDWRAQDQFFGFGLESRQGEVSNYAAQSEAVRASLNYPWRKPELRAPPDGETMPASDESDHPWCTTPRFEFHAWVGPRTLVLTNGRDSRKESLEERFPSLGATLLGARVEHLVYGARLERDTRSGAPHWTRGWRAGVEAERFDKAIEGLALRDGSTPARPFTRLTYEGEAAVSFRPRDPRTVRLAVKVVDQSLGAGPGLVLIPDLPHLGGREGLSGFEPGRFHDLDLVAGRLTYLFPMGRYLEMDLHSDAGGVYPDLSEARLATLKGSYGAALRIRSVAAVLGQIGVDWSSEKVRFGFSLGGVE